MGQSPKFISFEGGEGAGKSTQIQLLSEWLKGRGINHIVTREPGGCDGAERIRALILKGATDAWEPMTEALLMTAARCEHVAKTIRPALEAGKWVLCDRFLDSTVVYQGAGHGLGMPAMRALQIAAIGNLVPDRTFLFNIPVEAGLARAHGREGAKASNEREDRFERMAIAFHERLNEGYRQLAAEEPDRIIGIDASRDIESISADLIAQIEDMLAANDR